jgi:hypothetical protein
MFGGNYFGKATFGGAAFLPVATPVVETTGTKLIIFQPLGFALVVHPAYAILEVE